MIFPEDYKLVGVTREISPRDPVYFSTQYLIVLGEERALYRVASSGQGFMRMATSWELLASGAQVAAHEGKVDTRNRALLIELAAERCRGQVNTVLFMGPDEHITFVHQPDLSAILEIEVLDVAPPDPPWLTYVLRRLEESGVLGDLTVRFVHRVQDLRQFDGERVYFPCRASGLGRSLDSDRVTVDDPLIVGCEVSREIFLATCPGKEHRFVNICPVSGDLQEPQGPFITRCCRSERRGLKAKGGHQGVVVHWGDGPHEVEEAVRCLARELRSR
ncbi:MAG: hypothetical protein GKC10_01005 [Methanosarcinales archaeon]|nr:hypothetical protein [Methanosarcinales archaeon]